MNYSPNKFLYNIFICIFFIQFNVLGAESKCKELGRIYSIEQTLTEVNESESSRIKNDVSALLNMARLELPIAILDVDKLKNTIESTHLCINQSSVPLFGSEIRKGSVYFSKEKIIVINYKEILKHNESIGLSLMLLHEFLGAAGLDDQNYQVISLIYTSIHRNSFGDENLKYISDSVSKHLINSPILIENIRFKTSGGISGVGGGGDPEAAIAKVLALNFFLANVEYFNILHKTKFKPSSVTDYILNFQIETMPISDFSKISKAPYSNLQYRYINNKLAIVIEESSWNSLLQSPHKIEERTEFITNLTNLLLISYRNFTKETNE